MQEKRIFYYRLPVAHCSYALDKTPIRIHLPKPNKRQPEGQRLKNLELWKKLCLRMFQSSLLSKLTRERLDNASKTARSLRHSRATHVTLSFYTL